MISIKSLGSASESGAYYQQADYYADGELGDSLQSAWHGKGAEALGLSGEVQQERFQAILEGNIASDVSLGRAGGGGKKEHKPGWDFTLSAPKSVSVLALVGGDSRLIEAHKEAAKEAISWLESKTNTRVSVNGQSMKIQTGNAIVAQFTHTTSRELDPQLHTHNVIQNATQLNNGEWRSVESRALYDNSKIAGQLYQSLLFEKSKQLGYTPVANKNGLFELSEVPKDVLRGFSKRRIQIENAAQQRGIEGAKGFELTALMTRKSKQHADSHDLKDGWDKAALDSGFDARSVVNKSAPLPTDQLAKTAEKDGVNADKAVDFIFKKLTEREAVISHEQLVQDTLGCHLGSFNVGNIEDSINRRLDKGLMENVGFKKDDGTETIGYLSKEALAKEKELLGIVNAGQGKMKPIADRSMVNEYGDAIGLRDDQMQGAEVILSSRDSVVGVQGYAGVGKTYLLKGVKTVAGMRGVKVTGLAPTGEAVDALQQEAGLDSRTIASHLYQLEKEKENTLLDRIKDAFKGVDKPLWVIDEASMVSTETLVEVLKAAEERKAKVVLLGDKAQLGSVEWGKGFANLQAAGMQTATVDKIVRQKSREGKQAVYDAITGNIESSLRLIQHGSGVHQNSNKDKRIGALVDHYMSLSESDRKASLVLVPDHESRQDVNELIRERMKENKEIGRNETAFTALANEQLTRVEKAFAGSYLQGQVVEFGEDHPSIGVKAYQGYEVEAVSGRTVHLVGRNGEKVEWIPKDIAGGAKRGVTVYRKEERKLAVNDLISFKTTRKQKGIWNGQKGKVVEVDGTNATIEMKDGSRKKVDLKEIPHWDYQYSATAYAAQGHTFNRALILAESWRKNLINRKSFYVAISRAKHSTTIYTDDKKKLVVALKERLGEKTSAIEAKNLDARKIFDSEGLIAETRMEKQQETQARTLGEKMGDKLVDAASRTKGAIDKVREERGFGIDH